MLARLRLLCRASCLFQSFRPEELIEECLGPGKTLRGERHGLRLPPRVADIALLAQPAQNVPVQALPRPLHTAVVKAPEEQQCEGRVVDFVLVYLYKNTSMVRKMVCRKYNCPRDLIVARPR